MIVVAHRGASRRAPENTLEAFRMAVDDGADAIELDVHLSADGALVVIHDATLERTTDRGGAIADLSLDEIRAADAGHGFVDDEAGTPWRGRGLTVPTLDEVLAWLPEGIGLVVEIKAPEAVDATVATLAAAPVRASGAASLISFEMPAIERARELDPGLATGLLLVPGQELEPGLTWASQRGHAAVHPWEGDLGLDPQPVIQMARAFGLEMGCYVVNVPARMTQLAAAGLWGFVTDVPDVARATLGPRATS